MPDGEGEHAAEDNAQLVAGAATGAARVPAVGSAVLDGGKEFVEQGHGDLADVDLAEGGDDDLLDFVGVDGQGLGCERSLGPALAVLLAVGDPDRGEGLHGGVGADALRDRVGPVVELAL